MAHQKKNNIFLRSRYAKVAYTVSPVTSDINEKELSGQELFKSMLVNQHGMSMCFSYYQYMTDCIYTETKRRCFERAADFLVTYILKSWRPHLYYRYGCELGE